MKRNPQLELVKINRDHKFQTSYPSISVYTYVWRPLAAGLPVEECLRSWAWADELVVVNAAEPDEDDGTKELLDRLATELPCLKVHELPHSPRESHLFDGENKAIARIMCSSKICISTDIDEICIGSPESWKNLAKDMPDNVLGYNLPVFETIGSTTAFRLDPSFNPWKWRISWNKPEFTHDLPKQDVLERDGQKFSRGGSDGAFYTHVVTGELLPLSFPNNWFSSNLLKLRDQNPEEYAERMKKIFASLPHVRHVGHVNLKQKIKMYLSCWHSHWNRLFGRDVADPANNKYFPGVPVSDVTEEMIDEKVAEILAREKIVQIEPIVS